MPPALPLGILLSALLLAQSCAPPPEPSNDANIPQAAVQQATTSSVYPPKCTATTSTSCGATTASFGEKTLDDTWELHHTASATTLASLFADQRLLPGKCDEVPLSGNLCDNNPFDSSSLNLLVSTFFSNPVRAVKRLNNDALVLMDFDDLQSKALSQLRTAPFDMSADEQEYMAVDDQAYYTTHITSNQGASVIVIVGSRRGLQYGLMDFLGHSTWDKTDEELVWGKNRGGGVRVFNHPDVHTRISHQSLIEFTLFAPCDAMSASPDVTTAAELEDCIEDLPAISAAYFTELLSGKFTHVLGKAGQYNNPTPVHNPVAETAYRWMVDFLDQRNVKVIPSIAAMRPTGGRALQGPFWDPTVAGTELEPRGQSGNTAYSEGLPMQATLYGTCTNPSQTPETCTADVEYQADSTDFDSVIKGHTLGENQPTTAWKDVRVGQSTIGHVLCGRDHKLDSRCNDDTTGRHWAQTTTVGKVCFNKGDGSLPPNTPNDWLTIPLVSDQKDAAVGETRQWEPGEHLLLRAKISPSSMGAVYVGTHLKAWTQSDRDDSRELGPFTQEFTTNGWLNHVFKIPELDPVSFGPDGVIIPTGTSLQLPNSFYVQISAIWDTERNLYSDEFCIEDVEIIRLGPRLPAVRRNPDYPITIGSATGSLSTIPTTVITSTKWRSPIDPSTGEVIDATLNSASDTITVSGAAPSIIDVSYTSELAYHSGPEALTVGNAMHYIPNDLPIWKDDAEGINDVMGMLSLPRPDFVMLHGSDELRGIGREKPAGDWLTDRITLVDGDIEPYLPRTTSRRLLWGDQFSRFWPHTNEPNGGYIYGHQTGSPWPARRTLPSGTTLVAWHYEDVVCKSGKEHGLGFTHLDLQDLTGALSQKDQDPPYSGKPRTEVIGAGWRNPDNFRTWAAMAAHRSDKTPDSDYWEPSVPGLIGLMGVEWGTDEPAPCRFADRPMASNAMWNAELELLDIWHISGQLNPIPTAAATFPFEEDLAGALTDIVEPWSAGPHPLVDFRTWDAVGEGRLGSNVPNAQLFLRMEPGGVWTSPQVPLRERFGTGIYPDKVYFHMSNRAWSDDTEVVPTGINYQVTMTEFDSSSVNIAVTTTPLISSTDWEHTMHPFTITNPSTRHVEFTVAVVSASTSTDAMHFDTPAVFQSRPTANYPIPAP